VKWSTALIERVVFFKEPGDGLFGSIGEQTGDGE